MSSNSASVASATTSTKPGPPSDIGREHELIVHACLAHPRPSPSPPGSRQGTRRNSRGGHDHSHSTGDYPSSRAKMSPWPTPSLNEPSPLALLLLGQDTRPLSRRGRLSWHTSTAQRPPDGSIAQGRRTNSVTGCSSSATTTNATRWWRSADVTGDSFKLAREAAARPDSEFIVFWVHFMAESADILTADSQRVILPDLAAGCSMADMAGIDQVEDAQGDPGIPGAWPRRRFRSPHMNSSAAIKAFTGRHGGTNLHLQQCQSIGWNGPSTMVKGGVVPARSAPRAQHRCARPRPGPRRLRRLQPHRPSGGLAETATGRRQDDPVARPLFGARAFHPRQREQVRERIPGVQALVHPECRHEVVTAADQVGSTEASSRPLAGGRARNVLRWVPN